MKKLFVFTLLLAFFGLSSIPQASAHRGGGHYKEQKKAYKKGYKQGYRHARQDERCFRAHRGHKHYRCYPPRYQRRPVVYKPRTVSVNIPLPPVPPLPLPPFPFR